MKEKEFVFVNEGAKTEFLSLPKSIQKQFGVDLNAVQHGDKPFSSIKHLSKTIGAGAIELIENGSQAYRTIYCAKYGDAVYILCAFTKKTNSVDNKNMDKAKERYKLMMSQVKEAKESKRRR